MTPALNQSGFAPPGVVEVELGSLRPGQRFRSHGYHPGTYQDGTVVEHREHSVIVDWNKTKPVHREFTDKKSGETKTVDYECAAPNERVTASCPVEYLPDTAASPESEQEEKE